MPYKGGTAGRRLHAAGAMTTGSVLAAAAAGAAAMKADQWVGIGGGCCCRVSLAAFSFARQADNVAIAESLWEREPGAPEYEFASSRSPDARTFW